MQSGALYNDMAPALRRVLFQMPDPSRYKPLRRNQYAPRILLLSGSLDERSCSWQVIDEVSRLLTRFGAEARVFNPRNLPPVSSTNVDHPKVQELRALSFWSEGQVWCGPAMQGAMTSVFKNQIDWLPLEHNIECPTQSRTVAVMQVTSGLQRFGATTILQLFGRWIYWLTKPGQSNMPTTCNQFDSGCLVLRGSLYDRLVSITEELVRFTLLLRDHTRYVLDQYSERKTIANLPDAT
jgi:arsenic resistance protein ArsH